MTYIHKPFATYIPDSAVPDMPDPMPFTGLIFNIEGREFPCIMDSGVPNFRMETAAARYMGIKEGDIVPISLEGIGTVNLPVKLWYFTSFPPKFFLDRYDITFTPYEAIFTGRIHEPSIPFIRTGSTKGHQPHSAWSGFVRFSINGKPFDGLLDTGEYVHVINQEAAKKAGIFNFPKAGMVYWEGSNFLQGYRCPLKITGSRVVLDSVVYVSGPSEDDFSMCIMAAQQIIDRGYWITFTKDGVNFTWSGQKVPNRRYHP